jgi:hypothetical protein
MKNAGIKKIITGAVALLFLLCATYANLYAIRRMERYAVEVYFYDKLAVALQFGGTSGLHDELNRILSEDKQKREQALAAEFKKTLPQLKDPGGYLSGIITTRKAKIMRIKNFRLAAMVIVMTIFCWRFYINYSSRRKAA